MMLEGYGNVTILGESDTHVMQCHLFGERVADGVRGEAHPFGDKQKAICSLEHRVEVIVEAV